ncbi:unnamed protein product [Caenorhabditis auriculariae]|uniref:Uncharacterized protein n=1 Tax=Caenorhabditis auriculariae TaxID=2777116 RepID=A0A8S1GM50_9PELO|nr:unnamed protein product [Caenorhabditis auriculariae]
MRLTPSTTSFSPSFLSLLTIHYYVEGRRRARPFRRATVSFFVVLLPTAHVQRRFSAPSQHHVKRFCGSMFHRASPRRYLGHQSAAAFLNVLLYKLPFARLDSRYSRPRRGSSKAAALFSIFPRVRLPPTPPTFRRTYQ